MKKYNSNYIKNSKKPEIIEKIVNEFLDEEINKKPYDFLFRFIGEEYPLTNHNFLNCQEYLSRLKVRMCSQRMVGV